MTPEAVTFFIYSLIVIGIAAVVLLLTYVTGGRHSAKARNEVYESGLIPTGGARLRFPLQFYLIALFFLIFDLEVALLFLWALIYKQASWNGLIHITLFVSLLFIALAYPWAKGALDFTNAKKVSRKVS